MNVITTDTLLDLLPSVLFYFAVGTLGAFTKNTYETMTKQQKRIRLGEVIIGGIVTTIICIGLSDTLFKNFSLNLMAFVTFVLGGLGFEIFGNMTSIDKIRNLLAIVNEVRKGINPNESGARSTKEFEEPLPERAIMQRVEPIREPPPPERVEESTNESTSTENQSSGIEITRDENGAVRVLIPSDNDLKIRYTSPDSINKNGEDK